MRFSLKWILAGMVYVAIAAASLGTGKWYFADALWALSLLAVVYAIVVTVFAAGGQRGVAAGFVVTSICFVLCVTFGGDSVPTERLLVASGVGQSSVPAASQTVMRVPVAVRTPSPPPLQAGNNSSPPTTVAEYISLVQTSMPSPMASPSAPVDFRVYLRAANAVATLAFGLIGSLVGLMAFRASASRDGATRREYD